MTTNQKFWLKVALTVTAPVWVAPAIFITGVVLAASLFWVCISELVDDLTKGGE